MATVDPGAIEPGSIPYGDRQTLESNLPAALSQAEAAAGPVGAGGPGGPVPGDPLQALLGGEIDSPDLPITDGLSMGPGASPMAEMGPMQTPRAERVRQLATQATNPRIRAAARMELRRMLGEPL
jgi:hypothetical protein